MRNFFAVHTATFATALLVACGTVVGNGKRPDDRSDDANKRTNEAASGAPENQSDVTQEANSTSAGSTFLPVSLELLEKDFLPKLVIGQCRPIFSLRERQSIRRFISDHAVMKVDALVPFQLKVEQAGKNIQADWRTTIQAANEYSLRFVWDFDSISGKQNTLGAEPTPIATGTCEDTLAVQQVTIASLNNDKRYFEHRRVLTLSDQSKVTIAWYTDIANLLEAEIEYVRIVIGDMQAHLKAVRDEQGQLVIE